MIVTTCDQRSYFFKFLLSQAWSLGQKVAARRICVSYSMAWYSDVSFFGSWYLEPVHDRCGMSFPFFLVVFLYIIRQGDNFGGRSAAVPAEGAGHM
jgi:hypothetical protein